MELHKSVSSNPALEERMCLSISFIDSILKRTSVTSQLPKVNREKKDIYIKYNPEAIAQAGTHTTTTIIRCKICQIPLKNLSITPPLPAAVPALIIALATPPLSSFCNFGSLVRETINKPNIIINILKSIGFVVNPLSILNIASKKFLNVIAKYLTQYKQTKYKNKKLQVPLSSPDVVGKISTNNQFNFSGNHKANSKNHKKILITEFSSLVFSFLQCSLSASAENEGI